MTISFDLFTQRLREAQQYYLTVKHVQLEEKKRLATEEIPLVKQLMDNIRPFYTKKEVHGEEAVLLYVFNPNGKTFISPYAYLKQNGEVVYEVYDEENYRRYVPGAKVVEGYNIIPLDEFLMACPFHAIYQFLLDEKNRFESESDKLIEDNKKRAAFNEKFKSFVNQGGVL